MAKNGKSFEWVIKQLKSHTNGAMKYAEMAALMALEHFAEHGNASKLTTVYETLPKNFVRRDALVKWAVNFANVKFEDKVFCKDKDREDFVDLDGAREKPFWEFAPQTNEIVNFTADDLLAKVTNILKKHQNEAKMKPANAEAERVLVQIKNAVEAAKRPTATSVEAAAA